MGSRLIFSILPVIMVSHIYANTISPIPDGKGSSTLSQALLRLPVVASMLHTGAHPDDENSALLAFVSRGLHARTAYLSLTRGEGGQNLIGGEWYDAIGVIRTEELLSARRFDGADQFFTRAYDFGFSKSAEEALSFWNQDEMLLADMVRIIRYFRPDVIISVFADSPKDGHGQHQASGRISREAFFAAADSSRFTEQLRDGLRPWQTYKLFINNTRASYESIDSLQIPVGTYSPTLDRSYRELGLAGRSMHRSQDMGTIQTKGPYNTQLKLVSHVKISSKVIENNQIFDGLDTTFMRLHTLAGPNAKTVPFFSSRLKKIHNLAHNAIDAYKPHEPSLIIDPVLDGLQLIRSLQKDLTKSKIPNEALQDILFLLKIKEEDFVAAIRLILGVSFDALSEQHTVVPGDTLGIKLSLLNRSPLTIKLKKLNVKVPQTWETNAQPVDYIPIKYNERIEQPWSIHISSNAALTKPYWYRNSLRDHRVEVNDESLIGLPWSPQPVIGYANLQIKGVNIEIEEPVKYRFADPSRGEIRHELKIVPALSINLEPKVLVTSLQRGKNFPVNVKIKNNLSNDIKGRLFLEVPEGWKARPPEVPFLFSRKGQTKTFRYFLSPDATDTVGTYNIQAVAKTKLAAYREGYTVIDYPHTEPRHLYREAVGTVKVANIKWPNNLKIGYIMGTGDEIPKILEQMGLQVKMLSTEDLGYSDLSMFDVIIAGIRAYEVRDDLIAFNQRLLDYVEAGGVYIVQYNKYRFNEKKYGPYPFRINRPHDRVTKEDAPVKLLVPNHPIFNFPNRITQLDFNGWIQERGLYFLGEWDPRYTPLMSSQDLGESPKAGGLIEARLGKGRYIYTGYSWFRQLPAGVPGAIKLFTNMISLAAHKN